MKTTVEKALERDSVCFITHGEGWLASCALEEMGIEEPPILSGPQYNYDFILWIGWLYILNFIIRVNPIRTV